MSDYQASKMEGAVQTAALPPRFQKRKRGPEARKARMKEALFYTAIVVLPMIQLCFYYIYVNFDALFMSFQKWNAADRTFTWVGFENYKKIFIELGTKGTWFNNSLVFSIAGYFLGKIFMPLDIIFAFYCYKKMPAWSFFKGMLYLPSIMSGMVLGLINKYFFDNLIPELAMKWFGEYVDPLILGGGWRAYWTHFLHNGLMNIGSGILLYTTMMSRIPDSLTEYAYMEGCSAMREFFTITMPLIWGTFAVNMVGGVASIFTDKGPWFTYYGTGSTTPTNLGYYIYCLTLDSSGFSNYPYASACGMFFTLFSVPLTFAMRWLMDKIDPKVQY